MSESDIREVRGAGPGYRFRSWLLHCVRAAAHACSAPSTSLRAKRSNPCHGITDTRIASPPALLAGPQRTRFGGQNSAFAAFMAGAVPSGGFGAPSPRLALIKSAKAGSCPFPKQGDVDTYPSHPMALPGLPSQEASGRDRSAPNTRWPVHFRSGFRRQCNGLTRGGAAR
jgi:hypothetical protein